MGLRKPGEYTSTARCDAKKSVAVCNANGLCCVVWKGRSEGGQATFIFARTG